MECEHDDQARQPSLLPDWTVGHVATHIARNAEGHLRMLRAALDGDVAAMYPGGRAQRSADIEAGAGRAAAELLADVMQTAAELERTWAEMTPEAKAARIYEQAFDDLDAPVLVYRVTERPSVREVRLAGNKGLSKDDLPGQLCAFASGVLRLREKPGPILWQLPPNLHKDVPRLDDFRVEKSASDQKEANVDDEIGGNKTFDYILIPHLAGKQTMTIYKPVKKMASTTAEIAVNLTKGEKISKFFTDCGIVTQMAHRILG